MSASDPSPIPSARPDAPRGRGSRGNPPGRFGVPFSEPGGDGCEDGWTACVPDPATRVLPDRARSVVTTNRSPDLGFDTTLNAYRGCEHGCVYCYARPGHEYLGLSAGLEFETRIFAKREAPALLRRELSRPTWSPRPILLSGVTDPWQPVERRLRLTRGVLKVLAEARNPVSVITKSGLVVRDLDLLQGLAAVDAAAASLSITTLDADLARRLEPRAASPRRRLRTLERLAAAGIPVGVSVAPVIPGLTEHELPRILEAAAGAGARWAGYGVLRLPGAVRDLFADWLDREEPDRAGKVLGRIRELRGGRLNDPRFGTRLRGEGAWARQLADLFELGIRRQGLAASGPVLSTAAFRRPRRDAQLPLFSPEGGPPA